MRFLYAILAAAALAGCATGAHRYPPDSLLQDCLRPKVDVSTNAGLAEGVLDYDEALRLCNLDKKALREWASD